MSVLPAREDRGIVVFKLWPGLGYNTRMALSFLLIAAGFGLQAAAGQLVAGVVLLALGNAFLLVSGYDNRVDFGRWDPAATWERTDAGKLGELSRLDRAIKRWDTSLLDATNTSGALLFLVVSGSLAAAAVFMPGFWSVLAVDALVLFVPHWVTGVRQILTRPQLVIKVDVIREALAALSDELAAHQVHALLLLEGGDTKVPADVKFKVDVAGHAADFLGLYGQVVLNEVQGTSYPYFYVVLVARRGFGLRALHDAFHPPHGLVKEFKNQRDVEVMVLRQFTTKTSGYHTQPGTVHRTLRAGIELAEAVAPGK